jgi:hypothetical protein
MSRSATGSCFTWKILNYFASCAIYVPRCKMFESTWWFGLQNKKRGKERKLKSHEIDGCYVICNSEPDRVSLILLVACGSFVDVAYELTLSWCGNAIFFFFSFWGHWKNFRYVQTHTSKLAKIITEFYVFAVR